MSGLPPGLPVTALTSGFHESPEEGLCLLEAAAHHAGRPHSDHDDGVCPVLAAFGRPANDARWSSDAARTEALGPLVAKLAGSRSTRRVKKARARFLVRRALTAYAPLALASAVVALESHGIDCTDLRTAALLLCEKPSPESAAYAARAAVRAARAAHAAEAADAVRAARAAHAAHAAQGAAHAASDSILRLAADDLRAACEITEASL